MSGNALEEGVMQQLNNPSHTDVGRIAVPFGAIAALATYIALSTMLPGLWIGFKLIVAFTVFFALYGVTSRALTKRRAAKVEADMQARRAAQNDETERQITALKAKENLK